QLGGIVALNNSSVVEAPPLPAGTSPALTSIPNPARLQATLRFALPSAGPVRLALFDPEGRRVASIIDNVSLPAGPHDEPFAVGRLKPGLYFARLEIGAEVAVHKLLVIR